jgi:hypothetical protein
MQCDFAGDFDLDLTGDFAAFDGASFAGVMTIVVLTLGCTAFLGDCGSTFTALASLVGDFEAAILDDDRLTSFDSFGLVGDLAF